MTRKLILLNLVLLALAAAGVWYLRRAWQSETIRERTTVGKPIRPLPAPPVSALKPNPPVRPSDFLDIAQKDLFSRDRNPNVVVEVKAPPPPKPMPPLPLYHGVMNLGDGPLLILSQGKGGAHRDFRLGDTVGEFKLVAITGDELTLEWDGKEIHKRLDEIEDHSAPAQAQAAAPAANQGAQAAAPPPPPPPARSEPGVDVGKGMRACVAGDSSPAGVVVDGMRKRVEASPFGQRCWWESAQ